MRYNKICMYTPKGRASKQNRRSHARGICVLSRTQPTTEYIIILSQCSVHICTPYTPYKSVCIIAQRYAGERANENRAEWNQFQACSKIVTIYRPRGLKICSLIIETRSAVVSTHIGSIVLILANPPGKGKEKEKCQGRAIGQTV